MAKFFPNEFSDRMKNYESQEAQRRLRSGFPICVRLDGRRFSRFTRGFSKPFDSTLTAAMREACRYLVEHTHAVVGFVQSDEISLILEEAGPKSRVIFDRRVQKIASVFASMATLSFALALSRTHPDLVAKRMPVFDGRVWEVPSRMEAANALLWWANDAKKNAVLSAAHVHIGHKRMHGKRQSELIAMMQDAGVDFADVYPADDRYGVFYRRVSRVVTLSPDDLAKIPEKHRPLDGQAMRSRIEPFLSGVFFGAVQNRVDVIFDGAAPIVQPARTH